jgi:DNA-binding Xre family transcriptional regulator
MAISYKKLWKLLIGRDMTKRQLKEISGVSTTAIAKMGKGENVNTDTVLKICNAHGCDTSDVMEVVPD